MVGALAINLVEESLTFFSRYLHKDVVTRINRIGRYDEGNLCDVDSIDYFSSIGHPLRGKQRKTIFLGLKIKISSSLIPPI